MDIDNLPQLIQDGSIFVDMRPRSLHQLSVTVAQIEHAETVSQEVMMALVFDENNPKEQEDVGLV